MFFAIVILTLFRQFSLSFGFIPQSTFSAAGRFGNAANLHTLA
jgi:hypothetical protein